MLIELSGSPTAIPARLTAKFLIQICSALAYAHQHGIVHRDINPSNIIVQPNDHVKILDFGLACPAGTEDFSNTGTAYYMAPEQIDGGPVDSRTDIYALGITAYEMVTGRHPFPEDNAKMLLDMHLTLDIPDPGHMVDDIPEELRRFILKSGRRDPTRRYQDMERAMAVLRPLVDDNRLSGRGLGLENKKCSSLFLTYSAEKQPALKRLVDMFRINAWELGVDVEISESRDL